MIFSSICFNENISSYSTGIRKALEYLKSTDFKTMESGTYAIDGDKIYATIMDISTVRKDEKRPEVHKEYVDVHYLVLGKEKIGYSLNLKNNQIIDGSDDSDIYFYENVDDENFLIAIPGCYCIFFPDDIHRTGLICENHSERIRKVVVKVHINEL